jgi:flavin reductase (DIM6/NTAB) family NADH-FMN oxidoreductase RutF
MPIDPASFRQALAQFSSGVTVVTTRSADGRPLGLTVTAFCSVSLEPPLVLVSVDARSEANAALRASGLFAVSVLAEGQADVSRQFARAGPDKFTRVELETGENGLPLVVGALAHLECAVRSTHAEGDHLIHVGEIERAVVRPGRPLVYHRGGYRHLAGEDP